MIKPTRSFPAGASSVRTAVGTVGAVEQPTKSVKEEAMIDHARELPIVTS
jgi:hypothetical protein